MFKIFGINITSIAISLLIAIFDWVILFYIFLFDPFIMIVNYTCSLNTFKLKFTLEIKINHTYMKFHSNK